MPMLSCRHCKETVKNIQGLSVHMKCNHTAAYEAEIKKPYSLKSKEANESEEPPQKTSQEFILNTATVNLPQSISILDVDESGDKPSTSKRWGQRILNV